MLIDWFTVGAQVLNFVVLVWLMKRFLYRPVLDAIAAREKRIADQIADAEAKQAQAAEERSAFEEKNAAFDRERAALLTQAKADAAAEGQRLLADTKQAADAQAHQRQQALKTEAEHLNEAIGDRARQEVFAIARKALSDLAGVSLNERIAEVFVQRLQALAEPAKVRLTDALKSTREPALLRSAFELTAGARAAIAQALNEQLSTDVDLRFETAPKLLSGIELSVGGEKLGWTIDEYLDSLQESVAEVMAGASRPAAPKQSERASNTANATAAEPAPSAP
jgi:F-type H+-transporting ATPase subunit b